MNKVKLISKIRSILRPLVAALLHGYLWLMTSRPAVALHKSLCAPDTAKWRWETERLGNYDKVCVFVTYAPGGQIPERAIQHASIWRSEGYVVLFVVALDDFSVRPVIPFGHAICRENIGHDFAAWSRALAEIPLGETEVLATVNDSVYASPSLVNSIRDAEKSDADMVGFTENHEGRWHMQSYAVIFKEPCINSAAFADFWRPRLGSRRQVIWTYEVQMAGSMARDGFKVEALYPIESRLNPTHFHWPELLNLGFPYLKRSSLPRRYDEWYALFARYGFDANLIANDRPPEATQPRWKRYLGWLIEE